MADTKAASSAKAPEGPQASNQPVALDTINGTLAAEKAADGQIHKNQRVVPTLDLSKCLDEASLVEQIKLVIAAQVAAKAGAFIGIYKGAPRSVPAKAPMFAGANPYAEFAKRWERGNQLFHGQVGPTSLKALLVAKFGKPGDQKAYKASNADNVDLDSVE